MSKIMFRYFFDFVDGQEKWLNKLAECGYQLKKCGKIAYVFDKCQPDEFEYKVEFVGHKSFPQAKEYRDYLEHMGYRTMTKNINLNFSVGKIRWRPYAVGRGMLATSPGGINKELLILEKKRDGRPFELHTDVSDKLERYRMVKRTYMWALFLMILLCALTWIPNGASLSIEMILVFRILFITASILFAIPTAKYSFLVKRLKEESKIYE